MNRISTKTTAFTLAVALALAPLNSSAGWMDDFYTSAGAGRNITAPTAINTQSVTGFSGGGVSWRVPSTTITPFQITPPSLKTGCGGGDLFLGGYSFVNKAQFVQALRNFGQASVGYFFQLAIRSMAPEVAVTLDAINDMAQKVNQFGANSCKMAQLAIDSTAGKFFEANKREASGYARQVGEFIDDFDATMGMQTGGGSKIYEEKYMAKYGKAKSLLTATDVCSNGAVDLNAIYWLMCNAKLVLTDDERNLVMSMFGADIIKVVAASDGESMPSPDARGPTIDLLQLVGKPGETAVTLDVLTCADAECTSLTVSSQAHRPFAAIIESALDKIQAGVTGRTAVALDAETQMVLKLSSVPLWRVAALSATSGLGAASANALRGDLAEVTAVQAGVQFMNHYMNQVDIALLTSGSKVPAGFDVKAMHDRVVALRKQAMDLQQRVYSERGNPWNKIDQLDKIEKAMFSNMSQQLASNQRFSHRK